MLSFHRKEDDRYNSFKAPLLICKTTTQVVLFHEVQSLWAKLSQQHRNAPVAAAEVRALVYGAAVPLAARVLCSIALTRFCATYTNVTGIKH